MYKAREDKHVNIAPFHFVSAWFAKVFLLSFSIRVQNNLDRYEQIADLVRIIFW